MKHWKSELREGKNLARKVIMIAAAAGNSNSKVCSHTPLPSGGGAKLDNRKKSN